MHRFSAHLCGPLSLDKECRAYGCPRLHLNTPWWHVAVALTPGGRFARGLSGWWMVGKQ